jgi:hypothetical protein
MAPVLADLVGIVGLVGIVWGFYRHCGDGGSASSVSLVDPLHWLIYIRHHE